MAGRTACSVATRTIPGRRRSALILAREDGCCSRAKERQNKELKLTKPARGASQLNSVLGRLWGSDEALRCCGSRRRSSGLRPLDTAHRLHLGAPWVARLSRAPCEC